MEYNERGVERVKESLKSCPVCQKDLEQHPNDDRKLSCFVHGDFVIRWNTNNTVWVTWEFLDVNG